MSKSSAARFYLDQPLQVGLLTLPAATAHHLRVLRLRVGGGVTLFNASGQAWSGSVAALDPAAVQLITPASQDLELPFAITVLQSLIEPSKMDWVVEKCVELGAVRLQPIAAARSVTKLDEARATKRLSHWRGIAAAASEQCGRNHVMQVLAPLTPAQAVQLPALALSSSAQLLLHPEGGVPLQHWCKTNAPQAVSLWIGPEGGWSPAELVQLEAAGAQRVTFGARVLRTETAAASIAAALQALWCEG
jgi:16S rRNA (uracil1498-N3)-methyltransferase